MAHISFDVGSLLAKPQNDEQPSSKDRISHLTGMSRGLCCRMLYLNSLMNSHKYCPTPAYPIRATV